MMAQTIQCPHCGQDITLQRTGAEQARMWRQNNREKARAHNRSRRYKQREKVLARQKLQNAVTSGKMTRGPCELCGSNSPTEGHHDDYTQPLNVRWFCPPCHRKFDGREKENAVKVTC